MVFFRIGFNIIAITVWLRNGAEICGNVVSY